MATLESVSKLSDQKHKIEQYRILLNGILASGSSEECQSFVDHSTYFLDLPGLTSRSIFAHSYVACFPDTYIMKSANVLRRSLYCSAFGQCASGGQSTIAGGIYQRDKRKAATRCAQGDCYVVSPSGLISTSKVPSTHLPGELRC